MNKRFLPIFLALCLLAQTNTYAFAPAISRAVAAQLAGQAQRPDNPFLQAQPKPETTTPLQKPQDPTRYDMKITSYQDFEKANAETIARNKEFSQLYNQYSQLTPFDQTMTFTQGLPNYAEFVKDVRYIYIGEDHEQPAILSQITELLRQIREANPNKKILLATEFLKVPHPLVSPLHRVDKEMNYLIDGNYEVNELAKRFNMDTLALDDQIVQIADEDIVVKMGGPICSYGSKRPHHRQNFICFRKRSETRYVFIKKGKLTYMGD